MSSAWLKSITGIFSQSAQEPWEQDREGFFKAIRKNDTAEIKRIHAAYPNEALGWKTDDGSPLYLAHTKGRLEAFKTLVELGADINESYNVKKGQGRTPLLRAIEKGEKDFVDYILDNGGDANISFSSNEYISHSPIYFGTCFTPLSAAIEKGDESIVKALLAKGADPKAPCYGSKINASAELTALPANYAEQSKKFKIADIIKRTILQQAEAAAQLAPPLQPTTENAVGVMQPLKLKKGASAPVGKT